MKIIKDFKPLNADDTSVTITSSSELSTFPASNLKRLQPVRCWKSNNVVTDSWVKYDFGSNVTYDSLFLNRFNFADFTIKYSTDDIAYTTVEAVTGMTTDEIEDEEYMHRFVDLSGLTYRYIKIEIPTQTPLFDTGYFKIGNMLIGDAIEIWNPKIGFSDEILPKIAITEFRSGYIDVEKLGRTRRAFNGSFDKITKTEYDKILKTYEPLVLYLDFFSDETKIYLVRNVKEYRTDHTTVNARSMNFNYEEII